MMKDEVPPHSEKSGSAPPWADLYRARKEEENWTDEEELKSVKRRNDISWHRLYGMVVNFLMILFVAIFSVSIISLVLHYITPWEYLNEAKLGKIQSIIFSGTIGAIVTGVLQKKLDRTE